MSNYADRFFTTDTRPSQPERRREVRTGLRQFVEMRMDQEVFSEARTIDINTDGLRVQCSRPVEPGTRIFVMFDLPNGDESELTVKGEYVVVHCDQEGNEWRVGLRAFFLEGNSRQNIKDYLAQA